MVCLWQELGDWEGEVSWGSSIMDTLCRLSGVRMCSEGALWRRLEKLLLQEIEQLERLEVDEICTMS